MKFMNKKEELFNIDRTAMLSLKGLAILLVLLGHMDYIYRAGAFGVNLFLILSGYGIFCSYLKNSNKFYFKKKILKIYLPYIMVSIFSILYYIYTNRLDFSEKTIVFSLLGLDFSYIYDGSMWYISFIFAEYIIFYITCIVGKLIFK